MLYSKLLHMHLSGTAEAGTRQERLNTVSHSIYSRRQKTTLSQPADSQDNYAMSPHSAHCQHDQRRYYALGLLRILHDRRPACVGLNGQIIVFKSLSPVLSQVVSWYGCFVVVEEVFFPPVSVQPISATVSQTH